MGGKVRSDQFSDLRPKCPAAGPIARGASTATVHWLLRLKFGREMGIHPGRSMLMFRLGTPTPRTGGQKRDVATGFAADWDLTGGLEFAASAESIVGEAGRPC